MFAKVSALVVSALTGALSVFSKLINSFDGSKYILALAFVGLSIRFIIVPLFGSSAGSDKAKDSRRR